VFLLDTPIIAVVHRNLVTRYRDKGQIFVVTRERFEDVRSAILTELKRVAGA
jgi:nucleoside-triphosphatase THEP1